MACEEVVEDAEEEGVEGGPEVGGGGVEIGGCRGDGGGGRRCIIGFEIGGGSISYRRRMGMEMELLAAAAESQILLLAGEVVVAELGALFGGVEAFFGV